MGLIRSRNGLNSLINSIHFLYSLHRPQLPCLRLPSTPEADSLQRTAHSTAFDPRRHSHRSRSPSPPPSSRSRSSIRRLSHRTPLCSTPSLPPPSHSLSSSLSPPPWPQRSALTHSISPLVQSPSSSPHLGLKSLPISASDDPMKPCKCKGFQIGRAHV